MSLVETLSDVGSWEIAAIAVRAGLYAGVLLGVGSLLFRLVFGEPDSGVRRTVTTTGVAGAALGLLLALLEWPLRAAFLGGGSLAAAMNPDLLMVAIAGVQGQRLLLLGIGMAVVGIALLVCRHWPRLAAVVGLVGALAGVAGFGIAGHTGATTPWLLAPAVMLHLLAAAYWIGALVPLYRLVAPSPAPQAAAILERFGQVAVGIIAVLVLAGGFMAYWLTGSIEALLTSAYGQSLIGKVAFVALLLALGALNKFRLVPAFTSGGPQAAGQLRRSIRVEAVVAALVLLATAVMTTSTSAPTV